jgi:hypothetical protein
MPHGTIREVIPAPSAVVFRLVHDYRRRLEWDTLLQKAYLTDGYREAQVGAICVCQGRTYLGGMALKTKQTRGIVIRPTAASKAQEACVSGSTPVCSHAAALAQVQGATTLLRAPCRLKLETSLNN